MYRKVTDERGSVKKIHGVLSDYDLSLFFNEPKQGPSSKQRTGTRPYMAIDLLSSSTKHLYRHDLESLLYVFIVITFRFAGGKKIQNPPLQDWFDLAPKLLRNEKTRFMFERLPETLSQFIHLYPLLADLKEIFTFGLMARQLSAQTKGKRKWTGPSQPLPEFDEITLGGHVDFDKFEEVLFRLIKPPIVSPTSSSSVANIKSAL